MKTTIKHILFLFSFLIINIYLITNRIAEYWDCPYGVLNQKINKILIVDALVLSIYFGYLFWILNKKEKKKRKTKIDKINKYLKISTIVI